MKLQGNIFKYGDNVNTDVIIPARYLTSSDSENLKSHCMEDIDKTFCEKVKPNDIIVGGYNFGSGSSREHAPLAIKASGIQAVVAKSFARIFYRNSINIGLFVIEDEKIAKALESADSATIDYDNKTITVMPQNECFNIELPNFVNDILKNGGLVNAIKKGDFNV